MFKSNKTADTRVYAMALVGGQWVYLRFDDEPAFEKFTMAVKAGAEKFMLCYGQNNKRIYIKPSAVSAYSPSSF